MAKKENMVKSIKADLKRKITSSNRKLKSKFEKARTSFKKTQSDIEKYIEKNPKKAVAIAGGIGAVAASALSAALKKLKVKKHY